MREQKCNSILDEVVFIARASDGSISTDWVMEQPIAVRRRYVEMFDEEIKKREKERQNNK